MGDHLLEVSGLKMYFYTRDGVVKAVDGVSFVLDKGETLGVVGESGSGKSVTALTMMRLTPMPPGKVEAGDAKFKGRSLITMKEEEIRKIRGNEIAMIFQDPMTSLNPVYKIGRQIAEPLVIHKGMSKKNALLRAIELLRLVGIPNPEQRVKDYPHQFSGGMRQRIMIAIALALDPEIIIADEPTTALDVTVQAQVMQLLADLQAESKMGLILITHDLGVVADVADKIAVMYAGRLIEQAPALDLYASPAHPYTERLLAAIPRVDLKGQELYTIKGIPPNLTDIPDGCSFHPRCPYAEKPICYEQVPALEDVSDGRRSACHFWKETLDGSLANR